MFEQRRGRFPEAAQQLHLIGNPRIKTYMTTYPEWPRVLAWGYIGISIASALIVTVDIDRHRQNDWLAGRGAFRALSHARSQYK